METSITDRFLIKKEIYLIVEQSLSIFSQQVVALQWLREPCLLLGNKKNEWGLFHNQIDFFFLVHREIDF